MAGETYAEHPVAFHLRAMNMLYEGLKQNATIVVVPSTAVESMQLGNRYRNHSAHKTTAARSGKQKEGNRG